MNYPEHLRPWLCIKPGFRDTYMDIQWTVPGSFGYLMLRMDHPNGFVVFQAAYNFLDSQSNAIDDEPLT